MEKKKLQNNNVRNWDTGGGFRKSRALPYTGLHLYVCVKCLEIEQN